MADHSQKSHNGTTSRNIESSSSKDGLTALDCPLNEEVKQVEKVRYGEFGRTAPFNGSNGRKFHVGPPGYYTKIDNRLPYAERRQSLEELLAKHQEESARRSTEMEVIDKSTEALDPNEDPFRRCLDEYNWVFPKEIKHLADEYKIKIREKGQVIKEIWTKCKKARSKDKDWWYDYCGKSNETLSLGRKNGSRFRKMIMEEMEETLWDDGVDSVDET
ncbi:hypothetical protein Tco_0768203 [Tanacetum coccineum]